MFIQDLSCPPIYLLGVSGVKNGEEGAVAGVGIVELVDLVCGGNSLSQSTIIYFARNLHKHHLSAARTRQQCGPGDETLLQEPFLGPT